MLRGRRPTWEGSSVFQVAAPGLNWGPRSSGVGGCKRGSLPPATAVLLGAEVEASSLAFFLASFSARA